MATELIMPELGTTTGDMLVLKVLKKIGDFVKLGEPIMEVQTDKANVEVESYAEGYLKRLDCHEGDMVKTGALIAIIGGKDEQIKEGKQAEPQKDQATLKVETKEQKVTDISPGLSSQAQGDRVFVTPLAKRMAKDAGIDIATLKGTGPGGRIVKDDVLAVIESKGKEAPSAVAIQPAETAPSPVVKPFVPPAIVPQESTFLELSKMRRTIAQRLSYSFREIPHFYLSLSANMENAVMLKESVEEKFPERKFTYTDLIIKTVAKALERFPKVNSSYQEDRIVAYSQKNISLAISTDEGLITPTMIDPGALSLADISAYSKDIAQKARAGKMSIREIEPAAITISNLGMFGIEDFNAIINPPQSSILAVGAIKKELKMRDDRVCEVPYMKLTLSVDHRIIDGVLAAKFLNYIKECLENPELLLI